MESIETAAVLGLGLIGGSVARELAARGVDVLGWDRDAGAVDAAVRDGVVREALADGFEGIESADVIVIAVPVRAVPALLDAIGPRIGGARLVTDVGSTKRSIVAAAEAAGIGVRFVGTHPLAGDHRSGWEASRTGLFDGARVFLCPAESTSEEAMETARALWTSLGARPEVMDAEEHDRRLAWTSHLPQAVSTALALALAGRGIARGDLGPGGRDVTRLAGSSPEMWTDVARDNADALAEGLASIEAALRAFRDALSRGDDDAVRRFFEAGRHWSSERDR